MTQALLLQSVCILAICSALVFADDNTKNAELQVLKHFVGSWKSEGDLIDPKAGAETLKMKEEWTAQLSEEGELVIEGNRVLNDGAPDRFRWTMIHNPTIDLVEAVRSLLCCCNVCGSPSPFYLVNRAAIADMLWLLWVEARVF